MLTGDYKSLGEALPAEIRRVREEIIPLYEEIGPSGKFAILMMNEILKRADAAVAEQDISKMIVSWSEVKDIKL